MVTGVGWWSGLTVDGEEKLQCDNEVAYVEAWPRLSQLYAHANMAHQQMLLMG
jgi:hypothetical protein